MYFVLIDTISEDQTIDKKSNNLNISLQFNADSTSLVTGEFLICLYSTF